MPVPTTIHRENERPTDVGILAMEMYFPRRVSFSSIFLFLCTDPEVEYQVHI